MDLYSDKKSQDALKQCDSLRDVMLNMGVEKEAAKLRQVQPPLTQSVKNMMASVRFYSAEMEGAAVAAKP
jgi:hypothetical protein